LVFTNTNYGGRMFSCFKRSFVKAFYFSKIKIIVVKFLYFINLLIKKKENSIVAFIDYEVIDGKLTPYYSDNVYILCRYILEQREDIEITYIPSNQFGGKSGKLISKRKKLYFLYKRLSAKIILFKHPPHVSEYYTKEQHLIGLGYFIPFKADYWDFKKWYVFYANILNDEFDLEHCSKYRDEVLEHYTYSKSQFDKTNFTMITSSKYSAKTLARAHNWDEDVFKILGTPKSDKVEPVNVSISQIFNIEDNGQKVVLYTPTFRDIYIRNSINEVDKQAQTVFGYENEKEELEEFLVENNILLLIKLHKSFPFYRELEKLHIKEDKSYFKNCYFLDFELEAKYDLSIYNLFELSDAMIADYSSISFDYLPYDKPIIYNIPDIEEYRAYRGFSYEPMEDMMAGDKVKTIDEFKEAILKVKNNKDEYRDRRKEVLSLVNEIPKGKALENIYGYIEEIIN